MAVWVPGAGSYDRGIVTAVTARVPAKVNLQLSVGPPGADGYHDLVTVFHALALFDEVTVTSADTDSVVVTGEGARSVPADRSNLAARAVAALVDAVGPGVRDAPGLAIEISKRIPVAAGLAGGSADAAGALVACNELWGAGLSHAELAERGRESRQRRRVRPARRDRRRPGPRRPGHPGPGRRHLSLGPRVRGRAAVHPRGLRGLRPAPDGPGCSRSPRRS